MATILIIDDQPSSRDVLATLLGYSEHQLLEANDGEQGLVTTRAERPDLIITDIRMPQMDGFEFVHHLRADPAIASTPVIFYSATHSYCEMCTMAQRYGVSHVLPKPSDIQVILDTVHAALGLPASPLTLLSCEEAEREPPGLLMDTPVPQVSATKDTALLLRTMFDLSQELAVERDISRLLDRVCHAARELVGAQYALLGVVDEDGQALCQVMTSGLDVAAMSRVVLAQLQGGLGTLLTERCARRMHALPGDPQVVGLPPQYPSVYSFLGVPIMTAGHAYGWVCLINKRDAEVFSAEDEQAIVVLAMQAALAYENARQSDAIERYATQLEQEGVRREWAAAGLQQAADATLPEANEALATWAPQGEQRHRELSLLSEFGRLLQSCRTTEEAYTVIVQCCQQLFPDESGALYVFGAAQKYVEAVAGWGEDPGDEAVFTPYECGALRRGCLQAVTDPRLHPWCQHASNGAAGASARARRPASYLCAPMMAQGKALGVLHLRSHASPPGQLVDVREGWTDTKQQLAEAVVDCIALALANVQLRQTLHMQSPRDSLTGLCSRRYMEESLEREIRRAARHRQPIGVLMLAVDQFNQVNDVYGHEAGETLLRTVGQLLATNSRAEDIACRYDGEEFLLILPDASLAVTQQRAEHMRIACKHLCVQHRGRELGTITLSLGVAVFPEHGSTIQAILWMADAALYYAKAAGRDRVVVGTEPERHHGDHSHY